MNEIGKAFVDKVDRLAKQCDLTLSFDDVRKVCALVREEDKRARHAEQERDAFDRRIVELEAEVAKLKPDAEAWQKIIVPSRRYPAD